MGIPPVLIAPTGLMAAAPLGTIRAGDARAKASMDAMTNRAPFEARALRIGSVIVAMPTGGFAPPVSISTADTIPCDDYRG